MALKGSVTFLYLAALFTCCGSLLCFDCTQDISGCGDHFGLPNTAAAECDGTCLKRRGERYSNEVRYVEVSRTCVGQLDDGCFDTTWNGISVYACACNTDWCNAGNSLRFSMGGVLTTLVLVLVTWLLHLSLT